MTAGAAPGHAPASQANLLTSLSDDTPLLEVRPALGPPNTILLASPSKSATHRGILLGMLTRHTVVANPLISADTVASLRAAIALGAHVTIEAETDAGAAMLDKLAPGGLQDLCEAETRDDAAGRPPGLPERWRGLDLARFIGPVPDRLPRPLLAARYRIHVERVHDHPGPRLDTIDVENSGTTLRLATAIAALAHHEVRLTGDASLRTRPMGPLLAALEQLGARAVAEGHEGRPPVAIRGPLSGGTAELRGDVSSQYVSALLIAAQRTRGTTRIQVTTPLKSAPYVALTAELLQRFGGDVREDAPDDAASGPTFHVQGPIELPGSVYTVPGDFSSAASPLVAAVLLGGEVSIALLDEQAVQGDRKVLDVLQAAGCHVTWEDDPERPGFRLLTVRAPTDGLRAFDFGFGQTPDLFPALAALAARAKGTSRLHDAAHVRVKECDRVAAMARGLEMLGFRVEEEADALTIHGAPDHVLPACGIEAHDDHRILMAFTCLGLTQGGPLWITDPGCYHVSYPRFRSDIDLMGGETRVVDVDVAKRTLGGPGAKPIGDPGEVPP